ncbi:pantoate--beta-alanine ligase [Desulfobacterota bacterium M19]
MEIIRIPAAMTSWSKAERAGGRSLALVPTMGCLHAGHLSLMAAARQRVDLLAVSIFVNPAQFGPDEDFASYPRIFEADCLAAEKAGVDVIFAPEAAAVYPPGFQTVVRVKELTQGLCGVSRPGHFDGVATVVAKLFNIVQPQLAVFGEKDFQQLAVIRAMVRDLNFAVEIVGCPIVREADGLAMSSRNRYLSPAERQAALCLCRALESARRQAAEGERDCGRIIARLSAVVAAEPKARVDYLKIVNDADLRELEKLTDSALLMMAVFIGSTRLIDNGYLFPERDNLQNSINSAAC